MLVGAGHIIMTPQTELLTVNQSAPPAVTASHNHYQPTILRFFSRLLGQV